MSYNHKISDLKHRINALVPKDVCKKIIDIYEKYPELNGKEQSYKYQTKKDEVDNFKSLNLSKINNPNEDITWALNTAKNYINIIVINYVAYIKSKGISPTFGHNLINSTDSIRILKYEEGQCIKDHSDVAGTTRASCTLNLNEDYEGGEFRFFDGQIKDIYIKQETL